jgi:hypothetical protein
MRDIETRNLETLRRMRDLGESHADSFPIGSLAAQKFQGIREVIAEVEAHGVAQSGGKGAAQASTSAKRAARDDLRQRMVAVRETALAMEESLPGVSANFRIPRTNGDQALISAARAFVEAATPLKNEFLQREMPATFLEDLTAAVERFESALNEKNVNTEKRITATAAISAALERGMKLVRELDPIVKNKFRGDAATLAAWASASHVERPPKKRAPRTTPATPQQ